MSMAMSTMQPDAGFALGARPVGGGAEAQAVREARPAPRPSWQRIVGLTLLAAFGLALGVVVGTLIVVSSGLVALC